MEIKEAFGDRSGAAQEVPLPNAYLCIIQPFDAALRSTPRTSQLVQALCIRWVKDGNRRWHEGSGIKGGNRVTAGAASPQTHQHRNRNTDQKIVTINNVSTSLFIPVSNCAVVLELTNHKTQSVQAVNSRFMVFSSYVNRFLSNTVKNKLFKRTNFVFFNDK